MKLVETKSAFRRALDQAREEGGTVGLVPTMGAIHEGHLSLVAAARERSDLVAVTIFVNPLQFGESRDLDSYPRSPEEDMRRCERGGVDVVFAPSEEEMYPAGAAGTTVVPGPLAGRLEGASRPGHFTGVATIVTKLLSLSNPCAAYFGEKDFQQLAIVRRLVDDLDLASEIVACPTVRDVDGLAMSSRNRRLEPAERAAAPALWWSLEAGRRLVEAGERQAAVVEAAMWKLLSEHEAVVPDYAVVADPLDLAPLATIEKEVRLLVAARIGRVRLLDNLAARPPSGSTAEPAELDR